MALISGIVIVMYAAFLLFAIWRGRRDGVPLDRGLPLRLFLFAPVVILGALFTILLESTVILAIFLVLALAFAGFLVWERQRGRPRPPAPTGKAPRPTVRAPAETGTAEPPEARTYYRFQTKRLLLPGEIEIAYTETGKGRKTILFLHGLGSNRKCWRKNMESLSRHFRCIAIDFPGYGQSSRGNYPYNMSFFAEKVRAFIHQLDPPQLLLVGHSMGGQVAITTVLQEPGIAQKLVLLAPAGFETFSRTERTLVRSFSSPALLRATPDEQLRQNIEANFYDFPADAEFMVSDRLKLKRSDAYPDYCRMIPKCMIGMVDEPVYKRLPEIRTPTLVIFGADDNLIPNKVLHPGLRTTDVAEAGASRIPDSHLEIFSPCGHFVQWECAPAVNRSLINFFNQP